MRALLACFVSCLGLSVQAAQVIIPSPPNLGAAAYLLMDADTGKVIVENNATLVLPPASLTKMMTSYIVSEEIQVGRLKETDLVRISDDAWRRGGSASGSSTMFLDPRSDVSVIDLLRGVIIQSGNDASIALAQHIAGSEDAFAEVMNHQAKLLGMKNTHFKNATGWPAEGHVTTAYDLGLLAVAVVNDHPEHYPIHAEKYFKYNGVNQPNRNKLLFLPSTYVDGIKTGHTQAAGYGLVATGERDGMRLISVVLGAKSEKQRAEDSNKLLSYGYRYYKTHTLYQPQDAVSTRKVWKGLIDTVSLGVKTPLVATIPRGSQNNLKAETEVDSTIEAPISKGQALGKLKVSLDGEVIAEADLVAIEGVNEAGFFARAWDAVIMNFSGSE